MLTVTLLCLILSFVCFLAAAAGYPPPASNPRFNLVAAGLALWVLALLIGRVP